MYDNRDFHDPHFLKGSVMTYRKAISLMSASWERVTGKALDVGNRQPLEAFKEALRQFETRLNKSQKESVLQSLHGDAAEDLEVEDLIKDAIKVSPEKRSNFLNRDMDLVPPRLCLETMREVALASVVNDKVTILPLRDYLVEVMRALAPRMGWTPPLQVGSNRHFPRIWQWLSELSKESRTDESYGIRVINAQGPVARHPEGPDGLRVKIDPELF